MEKFKIETLSEVERRIYGEAATFLNEMALIRNTSTRRGASKKVKGARKKTRKAEKKLDIAKATPMHAFEATLGTLKMRLFDYLMLDCTPEQIKGWIFGMTLGSAKRFIEDTKESKYSEVLSVIRGDYIYRASLEVYNWLFKSGFMKRSSNIFKEYYKDGVTYSWQEDIITLKDSYFVKASKLMMDVTFENLGISNTVSALEGEKDMLLEIIRSQKALELALADIEADEATLKKAKYLSTQVKTLQKIMINFINDTSKDVSNSVDSVNRAIELNNYRRGFEPYSEFIRISCRMEGVEFSKENEEIFKSYYESLGNYSDKSLEAELKWLRGWNRVKVAS